MDISIDGIKTAFVEEGQGDPILFLHGWSKCKEDYAELAKLLSVNHRVYRIDLPGFGKSDTPPIPWSITDYTKFISHFISLIGLMRLIILGHSFGGRVAIKLAAGSNPNISQLILVDSAGIERKTFLTKLLTRLAQIAPISAKTTLSSFLGSSDYTKLSGIMRETFKKVVNENLETDLPNIHLPTLIIWGENDHTTPLWQGQLMHQLIQNSQLKIVPNANHGLPYRNAPAAVKIIEDFLSVIPSVVEGSSTS